MWGKNTIINVNLSYGIEITALFKVAVVDGKSTTRQFMIIYRGNDTNNY